jgi:endonuclease/exonuclease/phosphatase (EEP) superfamily protein YafD
LKTIILIEPALNPDNLFALDFLFYFSIFLLVITLIPLIKHDYWIFRVFEYPRLQKLIVNLVILVVLIILLPIARLQQVITTILIFFNCCYLSYQIYPFTVLGKKQLIATKNGNELTRIRLLIANVFQDNRKSDDYHLLIEACEPDLVLMVETNSWWQEKMDFLGEKYPHQLKIPLDNTYGMLLYSKLRLFDAEVKYLVEDDIPSIETNVELRNGKVVKLFCLHPRPPVPQENPQSTERDKEILLVAKKASECTLPVIVAGDLNDVAWSYTTELFSKVSGLLDPRRGRGFYNSFNAKYLFLRFPLDHIFCSANFSLASIARKNRCGSDHFPVLVELHDDPIAESKNEIPVADEADLQTAEEKINAEV